MYFSYSTGKLSTVFEYMCVVTQKEDVRSSLRLILSFNQVTQLMCVFVCVCNHFLFPIMALIHQLVVAMVFLLPPNQSHAGEHAQRQESQNSCNRSLIR